MNNPNPDQYQPRRKYADPYDALGPYDEKDRRLRALNDAYNDAAKAIYSKFFDHSTTREEGARGKMGFALDRLNDDYEQALDQIDEGFILELEATSDEREEIREHLFERLRRKRPQVATDDNESA